MDTVRNITTGSRYVQIPNYDPLKQKKEIIKDMLQALAVGLH
jgi:hypothetical protein